MAKLIELRDVYKIYSEGLESEVRALDGVSLTIEKGEFVAIVGQSGSGKSTMMNVLGCLDVPTYGEYLLEGTDVSELSDMQLSRIRNKEITARTPRTPSLIWSRVCKRHRRSWRRRKKMPPTQTPLRPLTVWSSA